MSVSGWSAILLLVPMLNLMIIAGLCIGVGDRQRNRFGKPNPDNRPGQYALLLGVLLAGVLILLATTYLERLMFGPF